MNDKLDNILLGLLWLLAMTLATSFWFNSNFGFNIFSVPHWQYLAHLQASGDAVSPWFYISMGIAVFIVLSGLYLIMQPHMHIKKTSNAPNKPTVSYVPATLPQPQLPTQQTVNHTVQATQPTPQPKTEPVQQETKPTEQNNTIVPLISRPPRLNLSGINGSVAPALKTGPRHDATPNTAESNESSELRKIFEDAGYTVKKNPTISGFRPALFAIGLNDALYIGATNEKTSVMATAIDKLNEAFTDTLDGTYINITGFIVNAPDALTSDNTDILYFDSIPALAQFIADNKNPPAPNTEAQEEFDAYSEYIDSIIMYLRNI